MLRPRRRARHRGPTRRLLALSLVVVACSKPPVSEREDARAPARDAADASSPPRDAQAAAPAAPDASAVAEPPSPVLPPSARAVKPKLTLVLEGDDQPGEPPPSPRLIKGVHSQGLPAITKDGRFVVALAESEAAAGPCVPSQLLVFERPKGEAPSTAKIVWRTSFLDMMCDMDETVTPAGSRPSASLTRGRGAVAAANAKLATFDLRSFDGGPTWTDPGPGAPAKALPDLRVALDLTRDADGFPTRARGTGREGRLFDVDLGPVARLKDPAFKDDEWRGQLTSRSRYDVDVAARVLLVRGAYMSANSWFPADRTTHLLTW